MSLRKIISKSTNLLLVLFVLFTVLPVKVNLSSTAIILLIILSIIDFFLAEKFSILNNKLNIFIVTLPLVVYIIGLFNTSNLDYGLNFLERNLSLLAFPIIFYSLFNYVDKEKVLKAYIIGLAAVNIYLIYLFLYYFNFGTKFYMIVTTDIYHSTYLGMYNLFAFWICFFYQPKKNNLLFNLLAIFFIISAIITSSRIIFLLSIISLFLTGFILIKSKIKRIAAATFTALLVVVIVLTVPSIKQKFNQIIEIEKYSFDKDNYQSVSSRFGKIEATLLIIKKNLWFGTGTGDLIDNLVIEYENMDFVMGYKYRYNPHNQYLDNIARNGIIGGGISLISIFLWPFILSIRNKNPLLLAFMFVLSGVCLTESVLNVHKGITFYAFFVSFLINISNFKNGNLIINNNE